MKKSAKVCWAIGLLIVQISITAIRYLTDYGAVYFISILSESIPTIGAIVLIFYDYKYNSPIIGNFTLLRAWSIGLIWVQPAISFLSWSIAGLIDSVIGTWIGSCVFIIITTILLVNDGKEFVKEKQNKDNDPVTNTEEHNTDTSPLPKLVRIDDETSIDEDKENIEKSQDILQSNSSDFNKENDNENDDNTEKLTSKENIIYMIVGIIIAAIIIVSVIVSAINL